MSALRQAGAALVATCLFVAVYVVGAEAPASPVQDEAPRKAPDAVRETPQGKPQPKAASKAAPAAPPKIVVGAPPGPDDFALRYFASLKQTARVNAELTRLKRLYPNYEPPLDPYETTEGDGLDEGRFWALYAADRLDELKAAVAEKQRDLPGWRPSADLARKMRRKELRLNIGGLFKAERFLDLVDYVKGENVDINDLAEEIDVLWTIAEAYARAKQNDEAVDMYKRILLASKDPHIRVATIQKALGGLRMSDVEALLAAVPGAAEGTGEFAALAIDITRARIAAFLHDARAEEAPAADIAKFEAYARESRDANQLGLLAWYDYKRRDYAGALEWFKLAIQNDGDAMIAHGLAHSLRALGMQREAEEVAFAWHEPSANNIILFLDLLGSDLMREVPPYVEPERLARYAKVTMESASGEGAQALAWYAYNSCQFDVALTWFERAAAWRPSEESVQGYALTLRKTKKEKNLYELANRYDGLFAKLIEQLFPDGYYRAALTPCDQRGAEKFHGAALRTPAFIVPGPALIPGAPGNYAPLAASLLMPNNGVTPIDMQTPQNALMQRALKNLKGKFPAIVPPENPLRFRPLPMALAFNARPPAFGLPMAPESPLARDPAAAVRPPLVASRVPGVGPMPYERYGFSLLPGWNGITTATWPSYSQQSAPAGTSFANQDAEAARAGVALFDARNPANARGLPPGQPATATYGLQPQAYPPQGVYAAPGPRDFPPTAGQTRAPAGYGQYPQPAYRNP